MTAAGAGLSAAGPAWNEFMRRSLERTPVEFFTKPDPLVDDRSMMNGDYHGPNGEIRTILYYANPNDPMFPNWDSAVQSWVAATGQWQPMPTPEPGTSATPFPFVTVPPTIE